MWAGGVGVFFQAALRLQGQEEQRHALFLFFFSLTMNENILIKFNSLIICQFTTNYTIRYIVNLILVIFSQVQFFYSNW